MASVPDNPKIYHITHARNLPKIAQEGVLWSDAKRIELNLDCEVVGMSTIKQRRLEKLEVTCHPGTKVGEYVPFYFCPRSIMLYILHRGNHSELTYEGGQHLIAHLQADMKKVVHWADKKAIRWAFSDRNAGGRLAEFYNKMSDLDKVNWAAVNMKDFRDVVVKEGKQAEFLVHGFFPWELVEKIGVLDQTVAGKVQKALLDAAYRPPVVVESGWYY